LNQHSPALALFRGDVDLVFTDLGMPDMSGWQVAEKVKSINGRIPVVLITGWNIELKQSETKESGVDLIIQKPFDVEQVLNLVQEGMLLIDRFKAV
jgi:CheY-like chemotaxis protein